ncbi:MAG: DUF3021 family protein [Ruminococcaceae bacterium]|nr:DUF3021 family protein [Oscillospiraceae bacterium]
MHGKEFLNSLVRSYFAVVTLVVLAVAILGNIFAPEERFGYDAFYLPLLYGAIGVLPDVIMYSRKELSVKALIVRKVLQLVMIEGAILFIMFAFGPAYNRQPTLVVSVAISIFIIYILVNLMDYAHNCAAAKQLNDELGRLKASVSADAADNED